MRRVGIVIVLTGLVAGVPVPALAAPSPPPPPPASPAVTVSAAAGQQVCGFDDSRVVELSGLVATDTGYVAINDSNDVSSAMRIFFFDRSCGLTRSVGYPAPGARDPEDLAIGGDGTLWVADIGDNLTNAADNRRQSIALWKLTSGSNSPVIHRLTYPDGPHDAEALVRDGTGTPVIVTKEPAGTAGIYTSSGPLQPNTTAGVALKKVGEFAPRRTGTPNFLGAIGQLVVTGGANGPDGRRVALRTYADAYEWDVPDGDVVKAITTGTPRITPLPGEPQGESIAYTRDGANLLTVSDQNGPTRLLRYEPVKPAPSASPAGPRKAGPARSDRRGLLGRLSLGQVLYLLGAAGVVGVVLVAIGAVAIRRSRARRAAAVSTVAAGRAWLDNTPTERPTGEGGS